MFTGIITDVGSVCRVVKQADWRFEINCDTDLTRMDLGASVACNGVCLTVVEKGEHWFAVEASAETLSKTTLKDWHEGTKVNLEQSLKLGDALGGHLVYGHVDGVATVLSILPEGDSLRYLFQAPEELKAFIAQKGSIALDGVSLTVNDVDGARFGVNIIRFTQENTTFRQESGSNSPGQMRPGSQVNLEIDMLARYVGRLLESAA